MKCLYSEYVFRNLDGLDIRIMREIFQGQAINIFRQGPRDSFRMMGRKLGVADVTVRERFQRLTRSGLIKESPIMLNNDLLGLSSGVLSIDVAPSIPKKELVEKLSLIDGVILVQTHLASSG